MVILIVITLISAVVCFFIAKKRKANTLFWVLVALLIGPFAIPFVFLSTPKDKQHSDH